MNMDIHRLGAGLLCRLPSTQYARAWSCFGTSQVAVKTKATYSPCVKVVKAISTLLTHVLAATLNIIDFQSTKVQLMNQTTHLYIFMPFLSFEAICMSPHFSLVSDGYQIKFDVFFTDYTLIMCLVFETLENNLWNKL